METKTLDTQNISAEEKAFEKDFFDAWPKEELEKAIQQGIDSGISPLDTSGKFKENFFNKYKDA